MPRMNDPIDYGPMTTRQVSINNGDDASVPIKNAPNGTILEFPSGRFRWPGAPNTYITKRNFGVRGQPDGSTVFEVPNGYGDGNANRHCFDTASGSDYTDNFFVENITWDSRGGGRANPGFRLEVSSRGRLSDITWACKGTISNNGQPACVNVNQNAGGKVLIERCVCHNDGRLSDYNGGGGRKGMGVINEPGITSIEDCILTGFPDTAVYSRVRDEIHFIGGLYGNCNVCPLRFTGPGSYAENVTLFCDLEWYTSPRAHNGVIGNGPTSFRGIWNDVHENPAYGGYLDPGGTVRDSSFVWLSTHDYNGTNYGGYGISQFAGGRFNVDRCQFLINGIPIFKPNDGPMHVNNCKLMGNTSRAVIGNRNADGGGNIIEQGIDPGPLNYIRRPRNATLDESMLHPELDRWSSFEFSGPQDEPPPPPQHLRYNNAGTTTEFIPYYNYQQDAVEPSVYYNDGGIATLLHEGPGNITSGDGGGGGNEEPPQQPNVLESWENSSLNSYTGQLGGYDFTTSSAYNGAVSLRLTDVDAYRSIIYDSPTTAQGDTLRMAIRCSETPASGGYAQAELNFGAWDIDNRYELRYEFMNNQLLLDKQANSTRTHLEFENPSYSYQPNTWIFLEVDWQTNGNIIGRLRDIDGTLIHELPTTNDRRFEQGAHGVRCSRSRSSYSVLTDYIYNV